MGGQLGVGDIPGNWSVNRAAYLVRRLFPEGIVVRSLRWGVIAGVDARNALGQTLGVPDLVGDTNLVKQGQDFLHVTTMTPDEHGSTMDESSHSPLVLDLEIVLPILPVMKALIGHDHTRPGRVMSADDGAGVGGGAISGGGEFVDVQGLVARLRHLETEIGTDDPSANDDCVIILPVTHGCQVIGPLVRPPRNQRVCLGSRSHTGSTKNDSPTTLLRLEVDQSRPEPVPMAKGLGTARAGIELRRGHRGWWCPRSRHRLLPRPEPRHHQCGGRGEELHRERWVGTQHCDCAVQLSHCRGVSLL